MTRVKGWVDKDYVGNVGDESLIDENGESGGNCYAFVEEIEHLRVQLAGCGVAAMQNTEKTIKDRAKEGDYGYSASYSDVCKAVDREVRYREALKDILIMGELDSNFPQDGRMYDIAKAALEI